MKNRFLSLAISMALYSQPNCGPVKEKFVGAQLFSMLGNLPGLHINFEQELWKTYGAHLTISGYRWEPENTLRFQNEESVYGLSAKAEARKYFSTTYLVIPLAFSGFSSGFDPGGYRYFSGGIGFGRKWVGNYVFLDFNFQAFIASKSPIRDIEEKPISEEEISKGHAFGLEVLPEKMPWLFDSIFPNMGIDANLSIGYAW